MNITPATLKPYLELGRLIAETRNAFMQHVNPNKRTATLLCDHLLNTHQLLQKVIAVHADIAPVYKHCGSASIEDAVVAVLEGHSKSVRQNAWLYLMQLCDEKLGDMSVWCSRLQSKLRSELYLPEDLLQRSETLMIMMNAFYRKYDRLAMMRDDIEIIQWYSYASQQLPGNILLRNISVAAFRRA